MNVLFDALGNWNPQLFRELKGRFNKRNLAIAVGTSLFAQIVMLLGYSGGLPDPLLTQQYNRYCTGVNDEYWRSTYECLPNALGNGWVINWQLWNFDLFIGLSILGIGVLLIIGSHLISSDLLKEEKRGTLGFVRLSPQPAIRIILGKLLGVPSLVYLAIALALPLHILVGLRAQISLAWIGMVDLVAIAAAVAFFSVAAFWSFIGQEFFGGFQAWLYSGALTFYLMVMTIIGIESSSPSSSPFEWLRMFYPGNVFYYLVEDSHLPIGMIQYFEPTHWFEIQWYGSYCWLTVGLLFVFGHYGVMTAIAWQGIGRRFYEPQATILPKQWGYGVVTFCTVMMTGFACVGDSEYRLFSNFEALQVFNLGLFFTMILLMTPTKQRLQDWSRFRHQGRFSKKLWADLLWGDRSPALGAIFVMILISGSLMAIAALNNPYLDSPHLGTKFQVIEGLIFQGGFILLCACLVQWLSLNTKRQGLWISVSLGGLTVVPFLFFLMFGDRHTILNFVGLLSAFPLTATQNITHGIAAYLCLAGQWLGAIASLSLLTKQIRRLGQSEIKTLLTDADDLPKNMLI